MLNIISYLFGQDLNVREDTDVRGRQEAVTSAVTSAVTPVKTSNLTVFEYSHKSRAVSPQPPASKVTSHTNVSY